MRRWLAVLMMVLLPLQFSWAAVTHYGGHEAGVDAAHGGHHVHLGHSHASADADPHHQAGSDGTGSEPSEMDCGHCHGFCAGMLEARCGFVAQANTSPMPALWAAPRAEHLPAQPERPQCARLA